MQGGTFNTKILGVTLLVFILSGCASPSPMILDKDFTGSYVKAPQFTLTTYQKITKPGDPVRIYIEGDGRAWIRRDILSDNPTPSNPLVAFLAASDDAANIAYIARPGQYTKNGLAGCDPAYWSDKRFSEEVVSSVNKTIDDILLKSTSNKIELVGYSGGAAIAVLAAARRDDVIGLITIAGNLDTESVNRYNKVSPLKGSLNPIDYAKDVANIPQVHYVGSEDKIIPQSVSRDFRKACGTGQDHIVIKVVAGAGHSYGWRNKWKELIRAFSD